MLEQYAGRLMQWCVAAGLVDRVGSAYIASNSSGGVSGLTSSGARNRRGRGFFLGDVPPERAEMALRELIDESMSRHALVERHGSKAFEALCALGLTDNRGAVLVPTDGTAGELIKCAAKANPSLTLVRDALVAQPELTGPQLGSLLARKLGVSWTQDTCNRNGNALRRWVEWTWPEDFEWRGRGRFRRLHLRMGTEEASPPTV